MSNGKSFAFIKEELNNLVEAMEFQQVWFSSIEGKEQEEIIRKLKPKEDFINFISLSEDEINLIIEALDFRYDNELPDEDLYYCIVIKEKLQEA